MPYPDPLFPTSLWDGLTKNPDRVTENNRVDPDLNDWDRVAAEVIAIQISVLGPAAFISSDDSPTVDLATLLDLLPIYSEVAGEPIIAGLAVVVRTGPALFLADKDEDGVVSGIALNAGEIDDEIFYLASGRLPRFDWTNGAGTADLTRGSYYYLGTGGTYSPTPPTSGFLVNIGQAFTENIMNVNPQVPILL